jgi:phosphatidylserine/phosphatidylglycerophosphate/cardiolipin synthase-like enzyme
MTTLLAISSCTSQEGAEPRPCAAPEASTQRLALECPTAPQVTVVPLDCWGRKLPGTTAPEPWVPGNTGASRSWELAAEGYEPTSLEAVWAGVGDASGLMVTSSGRALAAVALAPASEGGCPGYTVIVGLDHQWLACSGRPPSKNRAELFTSGEALYKRLAAELPAAEERVHAVTWWWQSDFELVRPMDQPPAMPRQERWARSVMALLESLSPSVEIRVIVEQFASQTAVGMAYVNTDPALRVHAYDTQDRFEAMCQGNPTPVPVQGAYLPVEHPVPFIARAKAANPELAGLAFLPASDRLDAPLDTCFDAASFHQKAWALDGRVAYVGGMNVKAADWDSDSHAVFDARRMLFKSSAEERQAVIDKEALPDVAPRKDYAMRLEGPAAHDVDEIIRMRWDWGRARGDLLSESTTPFEPLPVAAEPADGLLLQVEATMPEPFGERSILESMDKAIRNAGDFIYIEDQYFRMPVVLDAFKAALAGSPGLHVVVVTPDVSLADGAKKWTLVMDEEMRQAAGDRYHLFRARSFEVGHLSGPDSETPVFQDINLHSKMILVDEAYLNVGSCNKNNRGLLYEGELNVAVLDASFVRDARSLILAQLTGDSQFDWLAPGAAVAARLEEIADRNEEIRLAVEADGLVPATPPSGFLYPLSFTPDYLLDVGPDLF